MYPAGSEGDFPNALTLSTIIHKGYFKSIRVVIQQCDKGYIFRQIIVHSPALNYAHRQIKSSLSLALYIKFPFEYSMDPMCIIDCCTNVCCFTVCRCFKIVFHLISFNHL